MSASSYAEIDLPERYRGDARAALQAIAADMRRIPGEKFERGTPDAETAAGHLLAYAFKLGAFNAPRWGRWRERVDSCWSRVTELDWKRQEKLNAAADARTDAFKREFRRQVGDANPDREPTSPTAPDFRHRIGAAFVSACTLLTVNVGGVRMMKVEGLDAPAWPNAGVVEQFGFCCDFVAKLIEGEAEGMRSPLPSGKTPPKRGQDEPQRNSPERLAELMKYHKDDNPALTIAAFAKRIERHEGTVKTALRKHAELRRLWDSYERFKERPKATARRSGRIAAAKVAHGR